MTAKKRADRVSNLNNGSTQRNPYITRAVIGGFQVRGADGNVLIDGISTFSEARRIIDERNIGDQRSKDDVSDKTKEGALSNE